MDNIFQNDWREKLEEELAQPYIQELFEQIEQRYTTSVVYPERHDVFNALNITSFENTKVVILGQDPYHGAGQGHGLSFSVQKGIKQPPSLKNIFKELVDDIDCALPVHGSLESWAGQGVLLLNTVLTVEEGKPNSHQGLGWERFTDRIIELLNEHENPIVFILWGKHAQTKASFISSNKHKIITSPHPSPFAARKGFFGSKPFSQANDFLISNGLTPINWSISDD
ncbi:uracil-DNA glycosylase [Paenibacillus sp. GSMTC-2017]|uniref:uracil-DNA glycosylase n=1 Tax=Paenibacillus sp. GSMTC-2017 TaxID=2794350 RepID=UPI0018D9D903|nr:uracil-DNA glycosylase [Paenibacillus sp. GSMTC-2017]MBH5316863.1 uracil-DNA glycosylase [Paenibacillus sp. GSMTC-2017]